MPLSWPLVQHQQLTGPHTAWHMADQLSSDKCMRALQPLVGFTLNSVLASCNSWRFTTRSQKWLVKAAALRVLHACLANPLAAQVPAGNGRQYEPDWSLARAVAEAISRPGGPAGYLFVNLPPPEGKASIVYMPTRKLDSALSVVPMCTLQCETNFRAVDSLSICHQSTQSKPA